MDIEEAIKEYIPSCNIGVCVFDKYGTLFGFNEQQVIDGACTLKVFIMLDYVRQINEEKISGDELLEVNEENAATGAGTIKFLSYGVKVRASDLVELMVAISDHMAANILMDFLGRDHINQTIDMFGFRNTQLLKKYIVPKQSNVGVTTAYDYAKFYKMLNSDMFYGEKWCSYMKDILRSQKYKDFLAEPLFNYKNNGFIDMESKSGKVDGQTFTPHVNSCMNDGGICVTEKGNYFIAFLSEIKVDSGAKMLDMQNLMHLISENIFKEYMGK